MKLGQFKTRESGERRLGILSGQTAIDVARLARVLKEAGSNVSAWFPGLTDMRDVIKRGADALEEIKALVAEAGTRGIAHDPSLVLSPDSIEFLPAVYPGKILAIGRNYVDHAIEGGSAPPAAPLIFNKLSNSLSAHEAPIVLPTISSQVDYEAELAVVIGRRAKRVS